jgi:hypothetical protein
MKTAFRLISGLVCALILPIYGFSLYTQVAQVPDLRGNRFWFTAGVLLWSMIWVLCFKSVRLRFAYGLQHELNHYVWVELMGGKSHSLEMGRRGGGTRYVYPYTWGREVIDLAPYFFPLFALLLLAVKLMVRPVYEPLVCVFLGMSWIWFYLDLGYVLVKHLQGDGPNRQKDLVDSGPFFSTLVISTMTLFFTGLVWSGLSVETSIKGFLVDGPRALYQLWFPS